MELSKDSFLNDFSEENLNPMLSNISAFTSSIECTEPLKWDVSPNLELRKGNPRVVLKETNGRHDVLASLDELNSSTQT